MKNRILVFAAIIAALLLTLTGCAKSAPAPTAAPAPVSTASPTAQPEATAEPEAPAPTPEAPQVAAAPQRQPGERFEDVIVLEGMEETVRYEHVRNDALGFERDYDYEKFIRRSETARECFVSNWDDPNAPENYLEITFSPLDAESAAAAIAGNLSKTYELGRNDAFPLEPAGSCIRIDASADIGGLTMPDHLQVVYIIPAEDGCRIATGHYAIEASEGFGRRFRYMMNSFSVLPVQSGTGLTDAQALSAVQNYCCTLNPSLRDSLGTGDAPVYWEISSSGPDEIVVVFRSYTGALNYFYIEAKTGETYVTEFVPGIMAEQQPTGETLNVRDYLP